MKLIAFDPGMTTGIAVVDLSDDKYDYLQMPASHSTMWHYLNSEYPDQVIYEKFYYQRRDKVELYPVEVIGVIRLWCELNDKPVTSYSAAQAKAFWSDAKMRKIGAWQEGFPHATDAARHLLYHRVFMMGHTYILEGLKDYD